MKDKFALLPQKTYSLNEDMQEIPEVDWKRIYGFVEERLNEDPEIVLVANWNDLSVWYLGEGKLDYLARKTGRKKIEEDPFSSAILIDSIDRFEELVKSEEKGILVIDSWDDRIPEGTRESCRGNLKKELEIDRLYPVQPRLWPVEIYSWRI